MQKVFPLPRFKMNEMKTKSKEKIEGIIKTFKNYYVNSDITAKHFPIPDTIRTENWELLHFDKTITTEEVRDEMKKKGLTPANIYELAEWTKDKANLPSLKKYYIVAMGQEWVDSDGDHRVSNLDAYSLGGFGWDLGILEFVWHANNAFLCFRDLSQTLDTQSLEKSSVPSFPSDLEKRVERIEAWVEKVRSQLLS